MRLVIGVVAVLAASACSSGYAPSSPSGVDQPHLSLADSPSLGATAQQENCTLTQGFWKNHEDGWPVEELLLGGITYTKEDLLAILDTAPRGDVTYVLVHQLIAAMLSVANGADPAAIETTVTDANAWLATHPLGSKPTGADRTAGEDLAMRLNDYNKGLIAPGHCGSTPLPSPSPTPEPGG
jgi:hypothetical protein